MTAILIAIWLVLAVPVALFVGRAIALGLNSTHMPDDFDRHTREALAVVDEGRGPHVPADVMRIIDAASPKDQEDAKRAVFMKEGMVQ